MAVAFDAGSESHTGTTGSASEASFSWSHDPVGTPKGVGVIVFNLTNAVDYVSSITYDGANVPSVSLAATDTGTEPMRTAAYFLGTSVPATDPATIVVNRTNNANVLYAIAFTVTASTDTAVIGGITESEDQAITEENVDDGTPGTNSVRFCGLGTGINTPPSVGANSTLIHVIDVGGNGAEACYETVAGQGARPVGFSGGSDDVAAVYFAVKEAAAAATDARFLYLRRQFGE